MCPQRELKEDQKGLMDFNLFQKIINDREKNGRIMLISKQEKIKCIQDLTQALDKSNKSLEYNSLNQNGWVQKVRSLFYLGELQKAKITVAKALKLFPNNPELNKFKNWIVRKLYNSVSTNTLRKIYIS